MKRVILLLMLVSGIAFGQMTDWRVEYATVTLDTSVSKTLVAVDMYALFGQKGGEYLKPFLFQTDSTMTSTIVTAKIYNERLGTYMKLETSDGDSLAWTIEANKTYKFDPTYFGGVNKFQLEFASEEAEDRVITIIGRVY